MATTGRGYVGRDAVLTRINARFDSIDAQLQDLRAQFARMAEQLATIIELITENNNIQKRKLALLEAAHCPEDQ